MNIIKGDWYDKDDEVRIAQHGLFVFINSNGSKWAGQDPDDINTLVDVLKSETLRENLEPFIEHNPCRGFYNPKFRHAAKEPRWIDGPRIFDVDGVTHFSGNFGSISHVFSIYTNDPDTIKTLTDAIMNNKFYTGKGA